MQYAKSVLPNGLRVITIPMPSLESVTVSIWAKTGSRNENSKNNGISHFLEHMFFKGTTNRPTAKQIAEEIDSIGGIQNAGTSKEYTQYYIKCRADKIETAFDLLSDMTMNSLLDHKEIEREKGTIIEEIRMYEDTPMISIGEVFESLVYSGHTLGMDIAGTEKTVSEMKRGDFVDYRNNFYTPENMILTIAGGVDEKSVLALSQKYFSKMPNLQICKSANLHYKTTQDKPKIKLHNKKKEQTHVILGFLADGKNYKGKYPQTILSAILGGGMSSRMFTEVRERRGLAYAIRTSMDRYTDIGYIGTYAGLDTKRAVEAVKVMLDQHHQILNSKSQILISELTKAKEFLKGHLALALEDTSDVSSFFGDQELFSKKVLTPEEVFKKIDKVTMDEVNFEAKRLFVPERLNLAIIGPYKDDSKFKNIMRSNLGKVIK
ncbi:MAG: pitrilysin family protein [Candidatus Woesebacteria bacterium]|nr:pitrilysin family protein [Candidatus Woesebacteria bacterium]